MSDFILEVKDLHTYFYADAGVVKAVNGVNFNLAKGQSLGVVGESGSGKSITALSIMGLIQHPGKITQGQILLQGEDLLKKSPKELQKIRGNEIAMIFQDPMTSLNPVLRIGEQIAEAIAIHQKMKRKEAWQAALEMLKRVGIPEPEDRIKRYPHELSGGMRQRVMIAIALSCNPKVLIADEPTTALDVTIQAQILNLILKLQQDYHTATMLITHDLGVVAETCQNVMVMYAGRPIEYSDVKTVLETPKHPYTWGLLASLPKLSDDRNQRLTPIEGLPPDLANLPAGCPFVPRCPHKQPICHEKDPDGQWLNTGHFVRCHLYS
ncbi:oligopeptide transporter subunit; ATP-binding component of ABC superfamily [Candidatus Desulfosporosinus infrequens]|uniref:Oligopeptide transporter subunit ATP-binding component of ABC superfamily n=1 Tax=Candidatus Desulfosporosinus infrequens TaxID=2043169 RepID=A0A2U3JZV8_9FIRM|nr:oligopeptide transporter subunit; ATP-binding component of ABC superfamily [Candidatus Desulfosporosinus infrequens]